MSTQSVCPKKHIHKSSHCHSCLVEKQISGRPYPGLRHLLKSRFIKSINNNSLFGSSKPGVSNLISSDNIQGYGGITRKSVIHSFLSSLQKKSFSKPRKYSYLNPLVKHKLSTLFGKYFDSFFMSKNNVSDTDSFNPAKLLQFLDKEYILEYAKHSHFLDNSLILKKVTLDTQVEFGELVSICNVRGKLSVKLKGSSYMRLSGVGKYYYSLDNGNIGDSVYLLSLEDYQTLANRLSNAYSLSFNNTKEISKKKEEKTEYSMLSGIYMEDGSKGAQTSPLPEHLEKDLHLNLLKEKAISKKYEIGKNIIEIYIVYDDSICEEVIWGEGDVDGINQSTQRYVLLIEEDREVYTDVILNDFKKRIYKTGSN